MWGWVCGVCVWVCLFGFILYFLVVVLVFSAFHSLFFFNYYYCFVLFCLFFSWVLARPYFLHIYWRVFPYRFLFQLLLDNGINSHHLCLVIYDVRQYHYRQNVYLVEHFLIDIGFISFYLILFFDNVHFVVSGLTCDGFIYNNNKVRAFINILTQKIIILRQRSGWVSGSAHVWCNILTWLHVSDYRNFAAQKDGNLQINSLASNNCFSHRKVFQNGVWNALSKMKQQ